MGVRLLAAVCAVAALGMMIGVSQASANKHARSTLDSQAQRAIQDCAEDGFLDRRYTTRVLLRAGETLPSDVDQYTNCRWVIERQLLEAEPGRPRA